MKYVTVARAEEIAEGQQKLVRVAGKGIVVCKSEGQFFAFENRCTHDNEQLLGGAIKKCTIVCPMHGARFSLKNGAPFGPPAFEPITIFPVRLSGDQIEIEIAS